MLKEPKEIMDKKLKEIRRRMFQHLDSINQEI